MAAYFAGNNGNRARQADFALSIGAAVPAQVALQKLPQKISSPWAAIRATTTSLSAT
ncbi:MAG TPA: hypothetical protein VHY10_15190 [Xanthobacteraceae bacterium]|nr:hypothetical protein [Xanthobacteraceae bacterium]